MGRGPSKLSADNVYALTDVSRLVGVQGLALICAERTRETHRFQSSSAPRVLLSPRSEKREQKQPRAVTWNHAERLRAGVEPALVF